MGNSCCLGYRLYDSPDFAVICRCMATDIAELRMLSDKSEEQYQFPRIFYSSSSSSSSVPSKKVPPPKTFWTRLKMQNFEYRYTKNYDRIAPGCNRVAVVNLLFACLCAFKYPSLKDGTRHFRNKRQYLFAPTSSGGTFLKEPDQRNDAFIKVIKNIVDYSCSPLQSQQNPHKTHKHRMTVNGPEVSAGVQSILTPCVVGENERGDSNWDLQMNEKTKVEDGDALALCVTSDDMPLEVLKILLDAVQNEAPQLLTSHRTKRLRTENNDTTLPMLAASHACSASSKMTKEYAISLMSLLLDYSELDFGATERFNGYSPNILHYLCNMSPNALPFLELLVSASRITDKMLMDKFLIDKQCDFHVTKHIALLGSGYCTFFQLAVKQASPYFVGECVTRKLFRQEDLEAALFYACARSAKSHQPGSLDPARFGTREYLTDDEKAKFVTAVLSAFESRSEAIAKLKGKTVIIRSPQFGHQFPPSAKFPHGPQFPSTCLDLAYYYENKALQDLLIANGFDVTCQKH